MKTTNGKEINLRAGIGVQTTQHQPNAAHETERLKTFLALQYKQIVGNDFTMTTELAPKFDAVANWFPNINAGARKNWLFLAGGCGLGKTVMAKSVCNVYNSLYCRNQFVFDWRKATAFKSTTALQIALELGDNPQAFEMYSLFPKLMIDDIGVEPESVNNFGTKRNVIMEILSVRYDMNLPTIITTNLCLREPNQIVERYGERINDRLKEKAVLISFVGNSFRH